MGATEQLAGFAAGLTAGTLPDEVRDKVLLHTLDQVGAQVIGATMRWNRIVREYALDSSPDGPAAVVAADRRLTAEWAALANATAGHGLEIDDYHPTALSHPGCVAVPTVLAVGEALARRGADAVAALAAGFEGVVRIGLAVMPAMLHGRGIHETCVEGVFGAALAAGRLRGMAADTLAGALGVAGSHASGTTEYTQSGGEVKRLHAGLGAAGGIRAVELAARGFTGPPTVLEGRRGVLQAFCDEPRVAALTDGLGERWELLDCAIKPYFNCGLIHAPTAALLDLVAETGLRAEDVEEIVVGCDRLSLVHVGTIGPHPRDMTGAQFSAEFSLALALVVGGNDVGHYLAAERDGYRSPAVTAVAERVRLELDPAVDAAFPAAFRTSLRVRRRDGSWLHRAASAPGSPENPLSPDAVRAKFARTVEPVVGPERAAAVVRAVDDLADDGPVSAVLAALRRAPLR
jgi:2-methylcitrate dehydratase PrpD